MDQCQRMKDNEAGLNGLDEAGKALFNRVILGLRAYTVIEIKRVLCHVLPNVKPEQLCEYVQSRAKLFDPATNVQPGHVLKPFDMTAIVLECIIKWANPQQDMVLDLEEGR